MLPVPLEAEAVVALLEALGEAEDLVVSVPRLDPVVGHNRIDRLSIIRTTELPADSINDPLLTHES